MWRPNRISVKLLLPVGSIEGVWEVNKNEQQAAWEIDGIPIGSLDHRYTRLISMKGASHGYKCVC